jgi:hypothetical protein
MYEVHMPSLLELANETGRLVQLYKNVKPDVKWAEATVKGNEQALTKHAATFSELGLDMCRIHCERIVKALNQPPPEVGVMLAELMQRMYDECRLRRFMALSVKQADFAFPTKPLFGEDVNDKFPAAAFEIDEAGKCLGLSRPTAGVFHCMRAMEISIAAVARCLGIPDPTKPAQRNWGAILKSFKDELERRNNSRPPLWDIGSDRAYFEEVYVSLDAVRNPWRNATMHVENKYSDDEAEHVFVAVRGLMRKIASRMDENGEPKCP